VLASFAAGAEPKLKPVVFGASPVLASFAAGAEPKLKPVVFGTSVFFEEDDTPALSVLGTSHAKHFNKDSSFLAKHESHFHFPFSKSLNISHPFTVVELSSSSSSSSLSSRLLVRFADEEEEVVVDVDVALGAGVVLMLVKEDVDAVDLLFWGKLDGELSWLAKEGGFFLLGGEKTNVEDLSWVICDVLPWDKVTTEVGTEKLNSISPLSWLFAVEFLPFKFLVVAVLATLSHGKETLLLLLLLLCWNWLNEFLLEDDWGVCWWKSGCLGGGLLENELLPPPPPPPAALLWLKLGFVLFADWLFSSNKGMACWRDSSIGVLISPKVSNIRWAIAVLAGWWSLDDDDDDDVVVVDDELPW
jgi:hypothetical protein